MSENHIFDIIIIGGGPGGYTAALYAARAGLNLIVIEKQYAGGQMTLTEQIDNYPGFDDGVDGFYLAEKMKKQAERFGAESKSEEAVSADLTANPKVIKTKTQTYYAKSVVIATGASARKLGLTGEEELLGRGLSYCAACDGMFFKDKTVVVVGGGNSAAGDALLLSRVCRKVVSAAADGAVCVQMVEEFLTAMRQLKNLFVQVGQTSLGAHKSLKIGLEAIC